MAEPIPVWQDLILDVMKAGSCKGMLHGQKRMRHSKGCQLLQDKYGDADAGDNGALGEPRSIVEQGNYPYLLGLDGLAPN